MIWFNPSFVRTILVLPLGLALTACPGDPSVSPDSETSTGNGSSSGTSLDPTPTTSSSADDTGPDATEDTEDAPLCGDGIIDSEELCDDAGESPSCNADCTPAGCGDGVVNAAAGEACDESEFAGASCQTEGFDGGPIACSEVCSLDISGCLDLPAAPTLNLSFSPIKRFDFTWTAVAGADHYELIERAAPGDPYLELAGELQGEAFSLERPLHLRHQASYVLRACNLAGCSDSAEVSVVGSLVEAIGYVKASNTGEADFFGWSLTVSGDGNTLAVGAEGESSKATGIDGDQADDSVYSSGAVYVFVREGLGTWVQQAYVKASNPGSPDRFGVSVALGADGNTLVVGAPGEDSNATGISGNQANNTAVNAGAAYVFVRNGMGAWSQQAYIKASNTGAGDEFGKRLALSADANTLAVAAEAEDSDATGIDGNEANNAATDSGAVYVFVRDGMGTWTQQAYVKASNTEALDRFGHSVAVSGDGNTLAVGTITERSDATGIDGDQANNMALLAGAAYVFVRDGMGTWTQQAYVKASNTEAYDQFGTSVALSGDGKLLAVGAIGENSNATGIDGNQADNSWFNTGAVYMFERDGMGPWTQQAYIKASNTGDGDYFGFFVALSDSGTVLAVGAERERSNAIAFGGDQLNNSFLDAGAAYVFRRETRGHWTQQAYIKASNTDAFDRFHVVALSGDGETLAVGAVGETSNATGIGGDQADNSTPWAGAVYLY